MANDDFKKLTQLFKKEIRGVKDIIEIMKRKVDTIQMFQSTASNNIKLIKEQQSLMNEKLDNHTAALRDIESRLEGFADAWKINRSRIEGVEKHVGISSTAD